MIVNITKHLVYILAGVLAGIVIVLLLVAWLLSRGPVSFGFAAPYVSELINDTLPKIEAEFDDTILTWAGWDRAVDLRVINLRIRSEEGALLAQIPEVAFSISTTALLRGVIAPSHVELFGPTLYAVREVDGHLNLALTGTGPLTTGRLESFIDGLSKTTAPYDPLSYLTEIEIINADLIIEDIGRGRSWVTPDTHVKLRRQNGRIDAETSFLIDLNGTVAEFALVGTYNPETRLIDAGLSFEEVVLSGLAEISPQANFLSYFDVPVNGTATIVSTIDGVMESIVFNIIGGTGSLHLPDPFGQSLPTKSLLLDGHYGAARKVLEIREFSATFPEFTYLEFLSPIKHSYPLSSITVTGQYDAIDDNLIVEESVSKLGDISVFMVGDAGEFSKEIQFNFGLDISDFSANQIEQYWPLEISSEARRWVVSNFKEGVISGMQVDLAGALLENSGIQLDHIDGSFHVHNGTVQYVDLFPPLKGLEASASFDMNRIDFNVEQAQSFDLSVETAIVSLIGISGDSERSEIRAKIAGPFDTAMEIMNIGSLNLVDEMSVDPANTGGIISTNLALDFPILEDLKWEQVIFSAETLLEDISIQDGFFDLDVDKGNFEFIIENSGMSVTGELLLQDAPTSLSWVKKFSQNADFESRYEITTQITNFHNFEKSGIDLAPFSLDMVEGTVPISAQMVESHDGKAFLDIRAILDGISIALPAINWQKEDGVSGEALLTIEMDNGKITAIPEFSFDAGGLIIAGGVQYSSGGKKAKKIELSAINYGRTNISGVILPGYDGSWDANFFGPSLDLDPIWEDILYGDFADSDQPFFADFSLSAQFDRVWLKGNKGLDNLVAAVACEDETWSTVYITSQVKDGAPLEIKMTPSERSNGRILTVWSSDAGETLRAFDLYNLMIGGELSLTGKIDDNQENQPFSGELEVQLYRIVEAPALAKLVSLMSLTGILETLQGEGLAFESLNMPLEHEEGILRVIDAKATGVSLGFTASGVIYTHADVVDISGTVVPAYVLNSALGNLPVIGSIFSGGEEGSGVFAANYTMTGSRNEPEVSVNHLSVLAPGFLRNIFGVFEDGDEDILSGKGNMGQNH